MNVCRILSTILVASLLAVAGMGTARAETDEAKVKAAFLLNFALFVEWPPDVFTSAADPLAVCVVGKNPFGTALEGLSGRTVRNRKVQVRQVNETGEMGRCQVIFISSSEKRRVGTIITELKSKSVLTVSDIDRFVHAGGMIGLVPVNEKIRFEINQKAAREAQLKLSSNLLKLARDIVE